MITIDLSRNIIKRYVEVATPEKITSNSETVYGTVISEGEELFVMIDGSSILTPVSSNIDIKEGDRVLVLVKNHEATVIGSPSSPTARLEELRSLEGNVTEFGTVLADKVGTNELVAMQALIDNLQASDVEISGKLTANEAIIENLTAENETINGKLSAYQADIEELQADKIDATEVAATYATIESLNSTNANITNLNSEYGSFKILATNKFAAMEGDIADLDANKLSAEQADLKYANISFSNINQAAIEKVFSESGIINNLIVSEGKITGELVGVTIKGDIIEGGTVKADKLVIKGSDGLFYKLNTDGITTTAEQTEYNSLSGTVITAQSITAEKIAVDDLVAFDATIGGFNITNSAIYSGVKESAVNTTRGVYLDKDGQMAVGDSNNFVKYYKDQNGDYRLEISASSISFGSNKKSIETAIDELTESSQTNSEDLTNYMTTVNSELENLHGQIDGSIMTWFYEYEPTNSNVPASEWNTTDLKNIHLGDLFYNTITGYCYCWQVQNNTYSWSRITDVDVTKALSDAAAAKDTADSKRRVFVSTPTPPYEVGDLWSQGSSGDLMRCKTARTAGQSYTSSDWEKASKYTDDTTANAAQAGVNALETRVKSAETSIEQNSEAITLRATKTELTAVQTTAENAKTTAETAKTTAETAQTTAETAQTTADGFETRISYAETNIEQNAEQIALRATADDIDNTNATVAELESQLNLQAESIAALIRNGSDGSLVKQDANGLYYFDISGIETSVSDNTNKLNELDSTTTKLEKDVVDLAEITEYVRVYTDENDKPCIELGEGDSSFKLKITNEQIQFIDGQAVPAYISNQKLMIEKAEVHNELRFGNFVWRERDNGNMGLIWEEATS